MRFKLRAAQRAQKLWTRRAVLDSRHASPWEAIKSFFFTKSLHFCFLTSSCTWKLNRPLSLLKFPIAQTALSRCKYCHWDIHKKTKDCTCKFCEKSFTQKGNLKRHVNSIHKERKDYMCKFCGKAFSQNNNMKSHINKSHPMLENNI